MTDPIILTISALALVVSTTTAWLTLFRRGTIQMTQPTVIFFGPDTPRSGERRAFPKIYLKALQLYFINLMSNNRIATLLSSP